MPGGARAQATLRGAVRSAREFCAVVCGRQSGAPITNYIQRQHTECGGNLYVVWSTVDLGNGNYNWTTEDNQIDQ